MRTIQRIALVGSMLAWGCSSATPADDTPEITEHPQCEPQELTGEVHFEAGQACRKGAPAPGIFTESRAKLGLDFVHSAFPPWRDDSGHLEDFAGLAIADLNNDGLLDIYFTNGNGTDTYYLSLCKEIGKYHKQTLEVDFPSRVVTVADVDADGDRDLIMADADGGVVVRKNTGTGNFGPLERLFVDPDGRLYKKLYSTFSVAMGDLSGDGLLDIYGGNHEFVNLDGGGPNGQGPGSSPQIPTSETLYINTGDHTFKDLSELIPAYEVDDFTFVAALVDLDNDGDLDIYEVNDAIPFFQLGLPEFPGFDGGAAGNRLLRNDGVVDEKLKLTDVSDESGAGILIPGMGLAIGDYDNDGLMDLYITAMLPNPNKLLHNIGNLDFEDTTDAVGADTMVVEHDVGWGTYFFDADMDGWIDLFVIHGYHVDLGHQEEGFPKNYDEQANVLLHNNEGLHFEDVSVQAGLDGTAWSRSPAVGDLNRDGFPDLIVGNVDEAPYVYLNGCDNRPWLTVRLDKPGPNRDGLGARIVVKSDTLTQTRAILAGGHGLYGSSAPEAYFGFPEGTEEVTVTVYWGKDEKSVWPFIALRQIMTVRK